MRDKVIFHNASKNLSMLAKSDPEWLDFARRVLKTWDIGEVSLQAAVAMGLKQAYELGRAGTPPVKDNPVPAEIDDDETYLTLRARVLSKPLPSLTKVTKPVRISRR